MAMTQRTKQALVIGATGGVGGAVARALLAHGWRVRGLQRDTAAAKQTRVSLGQIERVEGDAMREGDVIAAAQDASIIFHGANPPGYKNWRGLAIPMLANSIAAARMSGARLIFPGNVYNFGPDAFPLISETSPQHPATRKGAIRVEMEAMLTQAAQSDVRSLIVRAGDFFGAKAPSSWFQNVLVKLGKPVRSVTYPGVHDVGHSWAYLPDLGETIARLADIEDRLPTFEVLHFGGHWLEHGIEMAEAISRAVGRPLPVRAFPWPVIYLAAPFVPLFRELIEMRYLWRVPVRLDNSKLVKLLGEEPHTSLDRALRDSLAVLDCLPEQSVANTTIRSVARCRHLSKAFTI